MPHASVKTIKDLSHIDRPRERMERYGVPKLGDHELVAILLGSGVRGMNVIELSKKITRLIDKSGFDELTMKALMEIRGLGKVKAGQVIAAIEYGRRLHVKTPEIVLNPEKVFELCADIRDSKREHFIAFYLNSRNAVIAREVISVGTLDASLVHPREVFEPALRHNAASILVAHNHPSGEVGSSEDDLEITDRIKNAGVLLGIPLKDHVILTGSRYLSLRQKGVLS